MRAPVTAALVEAAPEVTDVVDVGLPASPPRHRDDGVDDQCDDDDRDRADADQARGLAVPRRWRLGWRRQGLLAVLRLLTVLARALRSSRRRSARSTPSARCGGSCRTASARCRSSTGRLGVRRDRRYAPRVSMVTVPAIVGRQAVDDTLPAARPTASTGPEPMRGRRPGPSPGPTNVPASTCTRRNAHFF